MTVLNSLFSDCLTLATASQAALAVGLVLIAYFLYHFIGPGATNKMRALTDAGIPCMSPLNSEFQTVVNLSLGRESQVALEYRQFERYGKIYGKTEMGAPILMIGDHQILRDIFIKNFDCFTNRRTMPEGMLAKLVQQSLFFLRAPRWKTIRALTTPSFSAHQMRQMDGLMHKCLEILQRNIDYKQKQQEKSDRGSAAKNVLEIEAKSFFNDFVINVMGMSFFGIDVEDMGQPIEGGRRKQHPFSVNALEVLKPAPFWRFFVFMLTPFQSWKQALLKRNFLDPAWRTTQGYFEQAIPDMIQQKRRNLETADGESDRQRPKDFLTTLIKSRISEDAPIEMLTAHGEIMSDNKSSDRNESADAVDSAKPSAATASAGLTDIEIAAQCFVFLFAGFESTSTAISFFMHAVALHQDVQKRIRDEVLQVLTEHDQKLSYESVAEMRYLDACINEANRLYSPTSRLERECGEDCELSNGLVVKKGQVLGISAWYFHHSPQYFTKPEQFDPDRFFEPERRAKIEPYVFMPFGHGPRNCVGVRFAMLAMKMLAAFVLQNYKVVELPGGKTEKNLKMQATFGALNRPTNGVLVGLEPLS